jgi:hypothetical protein
MDNTTRETPPILYFIELYAYYPAAMLLSYVGESKRWLKGGHTNEELGYHELSSAMPSHVTSQPSLLIIDYFLISLPTWRNSYQCQQLVVQSGYRFRCGSPTHG